MSAAVIDFLRQRPVPALGWCSMATGLLALGFAAWQQHQWDVERTRRNEAKAAQDIALRQAAEAARRPRAITPDVRRLQHVAPQLQQSWLPTLRAVENATETPVFLLAMSIDPSSGRVQLDGEAPSFDHVLAYVQRLSDGGPLAGAYLASHESVAGPAGSATVRFTVLSHWTGRP
jgi:hypothetical protein